MRLFGMVWRAFVFWLLRGLVIWLLRGLVVKLLRVLKNGLSGVLNRLDLSY